MKNDYATYIRKKEEILDAPPNGLEKKKQRIGLQKFWRENLFKYHASPMLFFFKIVIIAARVSEVVAAHYQAGAIFASAGVTTHAAGTVIVPMFTTCSQCTLRARGKGTTCGSQHQGGHGGGETGKTLIVSKFFRPEGKEDLLHKPAADTYWPALQNN